MSTAPTLRGVDLKVGRAKQLIVELKALVDDSLLPPTYHFTFEIDKDSGELVYKVHNVPPVADEIALLMGEILHNLRSSLDHLAWQLVLLDGGTPSDRTQFPLRESPFNGAGAWVNIQLTPPIQDQRILDLLEDVQPYRDVDGGPMPPKKLEAHWKSHLWQLAKLNNIDKHRMLPVLVSALDLGSSWWISAANEPPPKSRMLTRGVEEGEAVAWFDFEGRPIPTGFDPHLSLDIVLREPETRWAWPFDLHNILDTFVFFVEEYVVDWRFRPLFTGYMPFSGP